MVKANILIVDDELGIIKFLRARLEAAGYKVFTSMDGSEALQTFEREQPDFVILDINMPKMDGFEVCRRLREWSQVPIIMLSARGNENDKVQCLNLGADDYITKPFSANELLARVNSVMRRSKSNTGISTQPLFKSGDLEINFIKRQVTIAGKEVKLTPTEYSLLQEFALNMGKVLTHTYLLNKVWGHEYREETQYLHVFVRRLRAKLEPDAANPRYITTVAGVGYQFNNTA
jgi:DNA-binding response OmpR family regulator